MSEKKLGIGTIEINKKFIGRDEAYKYAKRLIEFIRYTCKKNGWSAQSMVVLGNIRGNTSYIYHEQNVKSGRPSKKRKFNDFDSKYFNGNMNIEWHIHVLLVSKPSYAFRNAIKEYIDKNWNNISNIYEKSVFDLNTLKKETYKIKTNIGISEYFIDQSEDILFCNYNNDKIIPNGFTLKDLYKTYMKSRTSYIYCRKYFDNWNKKLAIDGDYYKIREFYYNITKDQNKKESEEFIKRVQIGKIQDNYNKVQENNNRILNNKVPF